nr:MAG TPA: hypothetical protein [Caudoviricetes sp.]
MTRIQRFQRHPAILSSFEHAPAVLGAFFDSLM